MKGLELEECFLTSLFLLCFFTASFGKYPQSPMSRTGGIVKEHDWTNQC